MFVKQYFSFWVGFDDTDLFCFPLFVWKYMMSVIMLIHVQYETKPGDI